MKRQNQKGITLVALVITIIILLILAGITIVQLTENGLFGKAKLSKTKLEYASAKEQIEMKLMEVQADCVGNGKEYTIEEIAKNIKEDKEITIEKYYNSSTASIKNGVTENLIDINGIVVSVDKNSEFKFLLGESCRIEGITKEEITDTTNKEIFKTIEEFEESINKDENSEVKNDITDEIQYAQGLKYAYDMKTIDEYIENAAEFNGSNFLQTENIGSAYTGTNSKTLSTWFKTNAITSGISGFAGIGADGNKSGFLCGVKNGYLYFDTGYSNFIRSGTDYVADGKWHNFTVTYDKNETRISLYLDSNEIYTNTGEINTADGPLLIGKSFSYCFTGSIASVRLYDRAISTSEASNLYNEGWKNYSSTSIKNGLTYEYIMKNNANGVVTDTANSHSITQIGNINYYEKTVTNIKDISGNKNDITVNKDLLKNSEGKYFLDFCNQNEYYQTKALEDDYLSTNSKTLMSWFKTDTVTSTINGFVGIGTDGSKTGFLCGVKDGYLYFDTGLNNFSRSGTDYVADGKWHHFAVSYEKDTKEIKLYLDGDKIYENTGDINTQKSTLLIGKSFGYTFNGQVTNVRLYNISVDEATINNIYNIEK